MKDNDECIHMGGVHRRRGSLVILDNLVLLGDSLVAQMVKNLPAMPDTWAQSLGREDPLEKGKATPSSILA